MRRNRWRGYETGVDAAKCGGPRNRPLPLCCLRSDCCVWCVCVCVPLSPLPPACCRTNVADVERDARCALRHWHAQVWRVWPSHLCKYRRTTPVGRSSPSPSLESLFVGNARLVRSPCGYKILVLRPSWRPPVGQPIRRESCLSRRRSPDVAQSLLQDIACAPAFAVVSGDCSAGKGATVSPDVRPQDESIVGHGR